MKILKGDKKTDKQSLKCQHDKTSEEKGGVQISK